MKPFTRTLRKTDHEVSFPKCPGNWLSQKDKIWYIDKGRQCWVTTLLDVKIGLLRYEILMIFLPGLSSHFLKPMIYAVIAYIVHLVADFFLTV